MLTVRSEGDAAELLGAEQHERGDECDRREKVYHDAYSTPIFTRGFKSAKSSWLLVTMVAPYLRAVRAISASF